MFPDEEKTNLYLDISGGKNKSSFYGPHEYTNHAFKINGNSLKVSKSNYNQKTLLLLFQAVTVLLIFLLKMMAVLTTFFA